MNPSNKYEDANMKLQSIEALLTAGAIALGSIALNIAPSQAQVPTFFCQTASSDGIPTTYANTNRGSVAVVKWHSHYFSGSGYTPMTRCQEVTSRFNTYRSSGQLAYITAGWQNGQPVLCAGTTCTGNNLLFTLRPDQDPNQVIYEIMANRANASGPTYQSSDGAATIDVEEYLRTAPVDSSISASGDESGSSTQPAAPAAPVAAPENGIW
jgi:Circadian oscillating protein COP23